MTDCSNNKDKVIHSPLDVVRGAIAKIPEYISLEPNNYKIFHTEDYLQFILVKGDSYVVGNEVHSVGTVSGSKIYSIPLGALMSIYAGNQAIEIISLEYMPTFNLCLGACPSKSGESTRNAELKFIGVDEGCSRFRTLDLSLGLKQWFDTLKSYLSFSYTDLFLYELKLQELFRLLNLEYTRALLNNFIGEIHCKESGFRRKVFALRGKAISLDELAEYLGLSNSILKRRFLNEFGMPPQKWLALQRSRYIFKDIVLLDCTIKEIAEKYEFSTTSYLSLFCKKYLGDTPQNIRRRYEDYTI